MSRQEQANDPMTCDLKAAVLLYSGYLPANNESSAQDNGEGSEHQSQDCAHHMACGLHPIILSLHSICRRDALTNKCANRDVKSTASGACCNMMNLLRGRIPLVRYASFSSGTCAACMDEHARIVEDRMLRCRIDRTAFCCCCCCCCCCYCCIVVDTIP